MAMREKCFHKGITLESNTYYVATEERYDIYLKDCVLTEEEVYFSYMPRVELPCPVGFFLKDLENVTIDFRDATLVFHGRITPFILDHCKNVRLINCKVDYDRPFYTQAHVLECNPEQMRIRIDEGFDYRVENGYLYVMSHTWEKNLNRNDCLLWLYDRTGEKEYPIILSLFGPEIFPWENPPLPIGQILVEEDGKDLILHGEFPESWEANEGNNSLVFTHEVRDKCTVTFVNCEDLYIENFILLHGAAYALMGMNSRNLYLDHFSMYANYQGNGRLVTNNADGVHLFNCKGDFVLKNSYMEGLLDDTVNIHNNYLQIVKAEGRTLICKFVGKSVTLDCPLFAEGDRLAAYRGKTLHSKGEYTVLQVALDRQNSQYVFTLDQEAVGLEEGDVIENLSGQPQILIENCEFGRFRGTMRLQSREKTIVRNCRFLNKGVSIIFTGDTTYWFESGPVCDFLIEKCSFPHTAFGPRLEFMGDVEYTEEENYYHKNVTVKDCWFEQGLVAILRHTDQFIFENNLSDGLMEIRAEECGEIRCEGNIRVV